MVLSGTIKVLHVDDDPDITELTATFLHRENEQFDVHTATNTSDALTIIAQNGFDCIVSDFEMPGQDGIEFPQSVREIDSKLPFILYTGKGSEEVASKAIAAGVTEYLQKEVGSSQYEVLANRIRNTVEGQRATERAEHTDEWASTLLEYSSDFVFVVDDAGEISYISPSVTRLLGYDSDELTGTSAFEIVHPDDVETAVESFTEILDRPNADVTVEFRAEHSNGSHRWLEVRGRKLVNDSVIGGVLVNARDITERKEREQELRQIQEEYETVFDVAQDALFLFDVVKTNSEYEFKLRRLNPAHEDISGLSSEDLRGAIPQEIVGEEQGAEVAANLRECVEAAGPISYDEVLEMPTRRINWRTKLAPVIKDGEVTQIVGTARDITDQEERVRRYDAIFNQTYQFTGLLEPDGTLIEANEAALTFGNLDREEVIGKKMWDAYWFQHSEETRARAREAVRRAANGEFVRHELPVQGAAGEIIIDFSVRPITNEQGEVMLLVPEGRDITELKEREQELQDRTNQLQDIIDTVEGAMWIRNTDDEYVLMNQYHRDLFDIADDVDIAGKQFTDLLPAEVAEKFRENDQRVYETEEPVEIEETVLTNEGLRDFLTRIVPLFKNGSVYATCGIATDITKQKTRERQLEHFTSIVSHDLRNPLSVATGRFELLCEEIEEGADNDHAAAIKRALARMEDLIDQILTLARDSQPVEQWDVVLLSSVVERCWEMVETSTAELRLDDDLTFKADKSRLQRLFENLFRNALDHVGQDVTVSVGALPDRQGFYVSDDGPGIPESDRESVFELGYTTRKEGTGFGLAIVAEVVAAHGWEIQSGHRRWLCTLLSA